MRPAPWWLPWFLRVGEGGKCVWPYGESARTTQYACAGNPRHGPEFRLGWVSAAGGTFQPIRAQADVLNGIKLRTCRARLLTTPRAIAIMRAPGSRVPMSSLFSASHVGRQDHDHRDAIRISGVNTKHG